MSKPLIPQLANGKRGADAVAAALEQVRLAIIRARDARAAIDNTPVAEGEAMERLEAWAASLAASGFARIDAGRFMSPNYRPPAGADVAELAQAVAARSIVDALGSRLRESYAKTQGLGKAERRRMAEESDRTLFELELSEEAIIRRAELAGMAIMRRSDADPLAVLAADEAMP